MEIENYLIELGHTEIFDELTTQLELDDKQFEQLRRAMHDKRKDEVYQLAVQNGNESIANELTDLIGAFGSFDMLDYYEEHWQRNPRLLKIIQHLKRLATLLKESGIDEILVDLGRVKHIP